MSRYDQPTQEPDYDRYEPKPIEDIDVPDFDQPDPPVDPAEVAAQAALTALTDLERLVVTETHLQRAWELRELLQQVSQHLTNVYSTATDTIDRIVERRR